MNNNKILYISTGLSTGGAEIVLQSLISQIKCEKDIFVISLTSLGEIGNQLKISGIPVYNLNLGINIFNPLKLLKFIKLVKQINPDVIHTWMYHANVIAGIIIKLFFSKKIIWSIHHSDVKSNKTKVRTKLLIYLSSFFSYFVPNEIIFCSQQSFLVHEKIGFKKTKLKYIPNGFNLDLFKPSIEDRINFRNELKISNDTLVIGMIARYDPIKNHKGFFEAASYISQKNPNSKFILVGKDIDNNNPNINLWISKYGLSSKVILLGQRRDISMILNSIDILALTSWSEAFPTVLGEAMSTGIPCVSTNVGDSEHIIGDTGIIVDIGDMQSLAAGCLELKNKLNNETLEIKLKTRQRIYENFNLNDISKQYLELYSCESLYNIN